MSIQLSDLKLTSEELNQVSHQQWDNELIYYLQLFDSALHRETITTFITFLGIIEFLSLVFCFPLILITLGRLTNLSDLKILLISFLVSVFVTGIIYAGLKYQADKWQSWLKLKSEVENYQQIIKKLELLEQLSQLENQSDLDQDKQEFFKSLSQIKKSLLLAIQTESLFREHQLSKSQQRSFLVELEDQLTALTVQERVLATEPYAKLYKEMLEIGVNVYQQTQFWR
ncbi:MAG: hypothetical protein RI580_02460 [Halothece sp. Uz-M2-17]|nr:hypothetical protein [Halothece sp. Uz-M2-17]